MKIELTSQGHFIIDNKVVPSLKLDDNRKLGQEDQEHQRMQRYFEPSFEDTLREVCHEVFQLRIEKKLRPFVEGEPIGAYKKIPPPRKYTPKEVVEYRNKRRQWAQAELLALRAKNNEAMR